MKITQAQLDSFCEEITAPENQIKRKMFYEMFTMYEGGGRELIEAKIAKEFKDGQAVQEMSGRLITINIMKKVVDKMAGVYSEAPTRFVVDENEADKDLLEDYEDCARVNMIQKESNRHLKMYKKVLKKAFVDKKGRPRLRVLQPFSYEVFRVDNPDLTQPDVICEIINDAVEKENMVLHFYSDESFWICNGKGEVDMQAMIGLQNAGVNDIGQFPFVYTTASSSSLEPIVETDLLDISISLPIVLTDLFFACKYQCWSMIYTINVSGSNINMNPSSVVELHSNGNGDKPEIGTIKPEVDSDKVIKLVESVLAMFLSSKGLSSGTLSTGTSAQDTVSGVSKMLDNAESVEDKKDQQGLFLNDESELWELLSKYMVPYWRKAGKLSAKFNKDFSPSFEVAVVFKEPKILLSEKDKIDLAVIKIEKKLSTLRRELANLNPDFTDSQIDDLVQEIKDEHIEFKEIFNEQVQPNVQDKPDTIV